MERPVDGASRFEDFYGIDALIGRLRKGVDGGESVHAYLFCGPAGTGKRSLAAICARALNCTGEKGARPCDACGSCQRYLHGTHPDHIVIEEDKSIKVDQVRSLIDRLSVRPYEGGRHTVVIERADAMTPQAQNALLKTLEEPPGSAVIFLLAEKAAPLLPTILSRVRLIRFSPLDGATCAGALERLGVPPDRARLLAQAAQGSVGRALALDEDQDYWLLRERVLDALHALKAPGDVAAAFERIKEDKASSQEALDIMEQLARARMEAQEGVAGALPAEIGLPGDKLLSGVLEARRMLASNVSWQSALEMMFFALTAQAVAEGSKP